MTSIAELIDAGFTNIRMYQLILLMDTPLYTEAREQQSELGIGTHFRVVPFDYGNYEFDADTRIVTAEIEEIVTSLQEMSYDEFFSCRSFALIVDTFYNQGVFQALLGLLKQMEISRYTWIHQIWESEEMSRISQVIDQFTAEAQAELWDSEEELEAFTKNPENLQRFLGGELGGKLIFKYKSILTNEYLMELAEIARHSVLEVIRQNGKLDDRIEVLVDDILAYEVLRKVDLFKGDYEPKYCTLGHDVDRFVKSSGKISLSDLPLDEPKECRFVLRAQQIDSIERALTTYGRDLPAMTKIVSFLRIESFYREFEHVA